MMTANEIRQRFLDFFAEREHRVVSSAPVVPHGDATLMFTNAGMNQFKDVFLGTGGRDYTRCADTQKCIRVSGKHNDLEEVGVDTYHHTFFEMLGNWSFGDYFKREAIVWAWEFLTKEMGLDPEKLYATVHAGDERLGLGPDEEAEKLWIAETTLPAERVQRFGSKDNFWEMGATGPCGPCSEIHLDLGEAACDRQGVAGHVCGVNGDCGRFIEIWNLVFIQFNHLEDGSLKDLPAKHVDTGMGFERLVSVHQGKTSNYDTDMFTPLFVELERLTGVAYGADERTDVALRVVADHVRTLVVAIADNVVPSNKDRGYVLRRLLRRGVRYGYQVLDQQAPFIHRLVPTVAALYDGVFPEIGQRVEHIGRVIEHEERAFLRTLERGVGLFEEVVSKLDAGGTLDGEVAFRLYETYGFPRDLTELMVRERSMRFDEAGWDRARKIHEERSKGATEQQRLDPTELEGLPATEFLGYWESEGADDLGLAAQARLLKIVDNEYVVLDRTPFYAESGGQVGDTGVLEGPGFRFVVKNTQRLGELVVHQGDLEEVDLARLPETVTARVDAERRRDIMANHTATHLLHWALHEVVSADANQKGSLVHPDYLRFDFTLDRGVTPQQLAQIERRVNDAIARTVPVSVVEQSYPEAIEAGVTALFGEKYGDQVRVVSVGDFSAELCGGTHCRTTGEIGLFQVISEKASSAGVRRIVAETRTRSLQRVRELREVTAGLSKQLGVPTDQLANRVEKLLAENKKLRKGGGQATADIGGLRKRLLAEAEKVGDVHLIFAQPDGLNAKQAADLADALRGGTEQVVGLIAAAGDRPPLVAFATKSLADGGKANATELVRLVGKGGGRPDFSKGSCPDPKGLSARLDEARAAAKAKLG
jgi:alanyl-tRNA synthetase